MQAPAPATLRRLRQDVARIEGYDTALDVSKHEGLFVGFSAGAAIFAAREIAREIEKGVIVCVLPDGGERYLSILW